jgi:hypothetical protein
MKGTSMDFSIASRAGYALVTDNATGETLVTVPWKTGDTMCFTVVTSHAPGDYEDAILSVLAMDDAGIRPQDHLPEEVRDIAFPDTQGDDATTSSRKAVSAAAHSGD